jgi:hypothetical protein
MEKLLDKIGGIQLKGSPISYSKRDYSLKSNTGYCDCGDCTSDDCNCGSDGDCVCTDCNECGND